MVGEGGCAWLGVQVGEGNAGMYTGFHWRNSHSVLLADPLPWAPAKVARGGARCFAFIHLPGSPLCGAVRLWQVAPFPAKSFWIFLLLCELSWAPFIEESPAGMGPVGFPSPCLGIPGPTLSSELESCCASPSAPLGEWGGRKWGLEFCTASILKPSPLLPNPSCPVASAE